MSVCCMLCYYALKIPVLSIVTKYSHLNCLNVLLC